MSAASYYVYYKVEPDRVEEVRATVKALMQQVSAGAGIQGQWQRRRDDPKTFMEIFPGVTDAVAFERVLAAALELSGFARLGIDRVTEIFQCA